MLGDYDDVVLRSGQSGTNEVVVVHGPTSPTYARAAEDACGESGWGGGLFALSESSQIVAALDAVPDDARAQSEELKTLAEGGGLTERDLLTALERQQIRKIDPMGEKFDHDYHQAMFEVPNDLETIGARG